MQADSHVREALGRLDYQRFKENITEMAKGPSMSNFAQLVARGWIETQLEKMGYKNITRDTFATSGISNGNLFATKVGTRFPNEMYIVSTTINGQSWMGADDNASGCSLVLELARVLASPDIEVDRSVRFIFFVGGVAGRSSRLNNGGVGSLAYANSLFRKQGIEDPPGSGQVSEPRWLGVIHHRMVLYDHGWPWGAAQSPRADIDIEYARQSKQEQASAALADVWQRANVVYAGSYPAAIGNRMARSDAFSFRDYVAAINVSENEQVRELDRGSNPYRGRDYTSDYSEDDYRFGFNAVQASLAAVAHLSGLRVRGER